MSEYNSPICTTISVIVVPLSVLSNWEAQIKEHCVAGALSYLMYYDSGRSMTAEQLKKFDVVITTYQIVTGEHDNAAAFSVDGPMPSQKKRRMESTLFEIAWKVCSVMINYDPHYLYNACYTCHSVLSLMRVTQFEILVQRQHELAMLSMLNAVGSSLELRS